MADDGNGSDGEWAVQGHGRGRRRQERRESEQVAQPGLGRRTGQVLQQQTAGACAGGGSGQGGRGTSPGGPAAGRGGGGYQGAAGGVARPAQQQQQSYGGGAGYNGRAGQGIQQQSRGGGSYGGGSGYGRPLQNPRIVTAGDPRGRLLPTAGKKPTFGTTDAPGGWGTKDVNESTYNPPIKVRDADADASYAANHHIPIETNHILTEIKFPKVIYHYEMLIKQAPKPANTTVTKALGKMDLGGDPAADPSRTASPARKVQKIGSEGASASSTGEIRKTLWRKIAIKALPKIEARHREKGGNLIVGASDFSKALYTTEELMGIDNSYIVESSELGDETFEGNNTFIVDLSHTKSDIDTTGLDGAINSMKGKTVSNLAEIEQVYNIVLKTYAIRTFIPVGRASFFLEPKTEFDIGGGLVNWPGFSSIYTFGFKPFINIDMANTAFIKGTNVILLLQDLFKEECKSNRNLRHNDVNTWSTKHLNMANELLKTIEVTYYKPIEKKMTSQRVTEVVQTSPHGYKFQTNDPKNPSAKAKDTNVEQYFSERGVTLSHKNGPCLQLGKKGAVVPAEICRVNKGQSYNKKLQDYQTALMIKDTAKPPAERKARIHEAARQCKFNEDVVLKEFGVSIPSLSLCTFQAPILEAPQICYGLHGEQRLEPKDGVWNCWDFNFSFHQPARLDRFKILFLESKRERITYERDITKGFMDMLLKMPKQSSMNVVAPSGQPDILDTNAVAFDQLLKEKLISYKKEKIQLALIVIPRKGHSCYNVVKKYAELAEYGIGVLTQCVAFQNVVKPQRATVGNLILKVNTKLGGVNHVVQLALNETKRLKSIDFLHCPTIIIGADVTHPSGVGSTAPSVAAVTGSVDYKWQKFVMTPQVQARADKSAAEIIENFGSIVKPMLEAFAQETGFKPRRIIIFRDGVGDGQYAEVLIKEMASLRAACHSISAKYEPKITFLTVQKRHKTRFFPGAGVRGVGKSGNVNPGALVDHTIVHPSETDYYLLSHQGIQGTSRPTRYHLLWDDSDFTPRELHNLTYYLCYGYARCNRAVSIPAPTYYAHLAAYRVRCIMEALRPNIVNPDSLSEWNRAIMRDESLQVVSPMHYI